MAFPNAEKIVVRGCGGQPGVNCNGGNNYAVSSSSFLTVNSGEAITGLFNYTPTLNAGIPPATWQEIDCLARRAGPGGHRRHQPREHLHQVMQQGSSGAAVLFRTRTRTGMASAPASRRSISVLASTTSTALATDDTGNGHGDVQARG